MLLLDQRGSVRRILSTVLRESRKGRVSAACVLVPDGIVDRQFVRDQDYLLFCSGNGSIQEISAEKERHGTENGDNHRVKLYR